MFSLSQYALTKTKYGTDMRKLSTMSVVAGLVVYGAVYLYCLAYNKDALPIINQYLIYFILLDLVIAIFHHYQLLKSQSVDPIFDDLDCKDCVDKDEHSETEEEEESEDFDLEDSETHESEDAHTEEETDITDIVLEEKGAVDEQEPVTPQADDEGIALDTPPVTPPSPDSFVNEQAARIPLPPPAPKKRGRKPKNVLSI